MGRGGNGPRSDYFKISSISPSKLGVRTPFPTLARNSSAVQLVARTDLTVAARAEDVHEFILALRAEIVDPDRLGLEGLQRQLLAGFAAQRLVDPLAPGDMPAHGRIPASGLDVLPRGTPLQVEFAARVENMQVHDRVQQHRAAVTLAARGPADDAPREVDHREKFFAVVAVHRIEIGKSLCKDNTKQPNHGKTEPLFYRTRDRYRCFAAGSGRKTVTKRETGNEAEDRRTRGRRWRQGPETRRGRWKGKIHPPLLSQGGGLRIKRSQPKTAERPARSRGHNTRCQGINSFTSERGQSEAGAAARTVRGPGPTRGAAPLRNPGRASTRRSRHRPDPCGRSSGAVRSAAACSPRYAA